MSTRAQIIVHDRESHLIYYRHSDGYPEGTMPSLTALLERVRTGELRDNTEQFSGWLIEAGRLEYFPDGKRENCYRWKIGAYEPSVGLHGDIEYLYVIDLVEKHIDVYEKGFARVLKRVKELCAAGDSHE